MLKEGDRAPEFNLKDSFGKNHKLKDFLNKGKKIILYFYPRDDTPGCTKEACNFRDVSDLISKEAFIVGVSDDSVESHKNFYDKYNLNFILLSDVDHRMIEKYGCWVEKNNYGKKYMGTARTTFIIDSSGQIEKVFEGVKPDVHSKEVIEYLDSGKN